MRSPGGYVLVFVDMLQSSDWNHSVKPEQIGLDEAWGSPSPFTTTTAPANSRLSVHSSLFSSFILILFPG